jgi:hypothetical protein
LIKLNGGSKHGKLNFMSLMKSKSIERLGLDSLGVVRLYHHLAASVTSMEKERSIADLIRSFCMFGVIVDHIGACGTRSPCQAIARLALYPSKNTADGGLLASEIFVRSIGNYKTVAGFAMTSAYQDSGE